MLQGLSTLATNPLKNPALAVPVLIKTLMIELFYLIFIQDTVQKTVTRYGILWNCRILTFLINVPRETKGGSICHDVPAKA